MTLINCEVNHILKWSSNCVVPNSTGARRFVISDTKLYVPVVSLLLQQLNLVLKEQLIRRIINKIQKNMEKIDI